MRPFPPLGKHPAGRDGRAKVVSWRTTPPSRQGIEFAQPWLVPAAGLTVGGLVLVGGLTSLGLCGRLDGPARFPLSPLGGIAPPLCLNFAEFDLVPLHLSGHQHDGPDE